MDAPPDSDHRCQTFAYDSDVDEKIVSTKVGTEVSRSDVDPVKLGLQDKAKMEAGSDVPNVDTKSTQSDVEVPSYPTQREAERTAHSDLSDRKSKPIVWYALCFATLAIGVLIGVVVWHVTRSSNTDTSYPSPWVWPKGGNITVGAYYYPWYHDDFHRGSGYLREQLSPAHAPSLGEYDDTDPATIYQHFKWSAQANIHLWVTSWWGKDAREDIATRDVILEHPAIGDLKIALFYETTGRIKESKGYATDNVVPDIEYICSTYFNHPNYYRINDRPVLFVYLTRKLEFLGLLDHVVGLMRQAAQNKGYDIFIVGDHVFQEAPDGDDLYLPFSILDAVTNYDVYGSMLSPTPYATEQGVQEHYQRTLEWRNGAARQQCAFIPSVSPGYNDLGVRPEKGHAPASRRLSANDKPGSLFKTTLEYARTLVDPNMDYMLMVNSFNEWHEDTQIEPVVGETTSLPESVTYGVEYQGYGEHYLNILREATLEGNSTDQS